MYTQSDIVRKELLQALDIPVVLNDNYEADDIIGTAVKLAEKKGMKSYAVTPDKDYMQLVTKKTVVAKPGRGSDDVVFYDVKTIFQCIL